MKPANSGCGSVGLRFEFGMELHGHEPGVVRQLDHFHQRAVGAGAGDEHAVGLELLAIGVVELVAMAMAFGDRSAAVALLRRGSPDRAALGWAPSRIVPPLSVIVLLLVQAGKSPDAAVSLLNSVEWAPARPTTLRANSITAHCMPRQMPKNGMPPFAGEANRLDLAFDAAFAETAGHQNAVEAGQQPFGAFVFDQLRFGCAECGPARDGRCRRDRAIRKSICRRRGARRTCRRRRS